MPKRRIHRKKCRICGGLITDNRREECETCSPNGSNYRRVFIGTINDRERELLEEAVPDAVPLSLAETWINLAGRL